MILAIEVVAVFISHTPWSYLKYFKVSVKPRKVESLLVCTTTSKTNKIKS